MRSEQQGPGTDASLYFDLLLRRTILVTFLNDLPDVPGYVLSVALQGARHVTHISHHRTIRAWSETIGHNRPCINRSDSKSPSAALPELSAQLHRLPSLSARLAQHYV